MRRWPALLLVAAAFLAWASSWTASASTPIPGTPVQVVDLGAAGLNLDLGTSANFSWAVFNGGPLPYTLNVSALTDDIALGVAVSPSSFVLDADGLQEVSVRVSVAGAGEPRSVAIHVVFATLAPVASNVTRDVVVHLQAVAAPVDVLTAFLAVGGIILIGFTAAWIFERTRVPDLLILIVLGLLLGPVALAYFGIAFVPPEILALATPYFTAIALMFILFDGGLNLKFKSIVGQLGVAGLHAGVAFVVSFVAVALVAHLVYGYDWTVALLLGAILDGTSGAVVIGIVRVLRVSDETKVILTLESVLTDVLAVVLAFALIELLRGGPGASGLIVVRELGEAFLIAMALGLVAGIGWILLLARVERKPFSYMLTIALLFLLYAATEILGGSGAMASFVFGIVMGNHEGIERRLRLRSRLVIDARIRQFHSEIAFLVRTFFFVFLGLVFTFQVTGTWNVATALPVLDALNGTFLLFLAGIALIFLGTVLSRLLATRITAALRPKPKEERRVLWSVMGRGLTTAVLASLPFTIPAFTSPVGSGDAYYQAVLAPYQTQFLSLAFFTILLTVGATTLGVASAERALKRSPQAELRVEADAAGLAFLRETDPEDLEVWHEPPGPAK